jgi:hypothetical protein
MDTKLCRVLRGSSPSFCGFLFFSSLASPLIHIIYGFDAEINCQICINNWPHLTALIMVEILRLCGGTLCPVFTTLLIHIWQFTSVSNIDNVNGRRGKRRKKEKGETA